MSLGGDTRNKRFSKHMPFEDDMPLSERIRKMEQRSIEKDEELTRLTKDLLNAVQRAETAEKTQAEDREKIAQLNEQIGFYRERSVMAMQMCTALVATIRGLLPDAGLRVLEIFKTIDGAVNKQLAAVEDLVKDHLAGNREFMEKQREARQRNAPGRQHWREVEERLAEDAKTARARALPDAELTTDERLRKVGEEIQQLAAPPSNRTAGALAAQEEERTPADDTEAQPEVTQETTDQTHLRAEVEAEVNNQNEGERVRQIVRDAAEGLPPGWEPFWAGPPVNALRYRGGGMTIAVRPTVPAPDFTK